MRRLFSFPNPVNDTSARLVAAGVMLQAVVLLILRSGWLLIPLTYGFAARVLTGPTLSPLGQLSTRVLTPLIRTEHRFLPGPPKRFAQAVGLVFAGGASAAWLGGIPVLAAVLIAMLTIAASLEAGRGICLGCKAFAVLMRRGIIPESVCEQCSNVTSRLIAASAEKSGSSMSTDLMSPI